MPRMHWMVHKANLVFGPELIDDFPMNVLDDLGPDATFAQAMEALDLTNSDAQIEFLNTWPRGQLAAVGAAVRSCLTRTPKMPITFAWAPAYDYEVTIWESAGVPESARGEMTIMFRSRYPGDENEAILAR